MLPTLPKSAPQPSQFRLRTGLRAGSYSGCNAYCGQEYNRCLGDGTPKETCDDRLPVCQNACTVCGLY
jgi:hypothetical protein